MFGNKSNEKKAGGNKKSSLIPGATNHQLNSLVNGTQVKGEVSSESDIRVDGHLSGTLVCKAKVIIGPTGFISGDVKCQNAVIEGRFEGTLQVNELLNIRENASIEGEVFANKLIVQAGADIRNFRYNMDSAASQKQAPPKAIKSKIVKANKPKEESIKEAS